VRNSGGPNGPDLLVTNSDGKVVLLSGIGALGKGSGFFQDINPPTVDLGQTIVQSLVDSTTGQLFALTGNGSISVLTDNRVTAIVGQDVSALAEFGSLLVAGFKNGSVGLLSADGALLAVASAHRCARCARQEVACGASTLAGIQDARSLVS
jgi:hypothetical protein